MPDDGLAAFALDVPAEAEASGRPRYARGPEGYEHLGVTRRTFFRWREHGDAVKDWPPFDEPEKIEAWRSRMQAAGLVKNKLPAKVLERLAAVSGKVCADVDVPPAENPSVAAAVVAAPVAVGGEFDARSEIKAAEERVTALRLARDEAYKEARREEGDRLDRQYWAALTDYTVIAKRVTEYLEKRGELVPRAQVEADLAPRVLGIVTGGMFFYGQVQSELTTAPDLATANQIWRRFWREKVQPLMQSRFVPHFLREAPEKLWGEVFAFVEARKPSFLALSAD